MSSHYVTGPKEQVNLSAEDKQRIARKLDEYGIPYIEGGWPGSNPKDARFFDLARKESFSLSRITAFGSTRRSKKRPEEDRNLEARLKTEAEAVAVFGKSRDLRVSDTGGAAQ